MTALWKTCCTARRNPDMPLKSAPPETTPPHWRNGLALRRGWNVRHVQQQKVVAAFVSCEPEAVAAELRQLCLDLPVIDFHRSERRLEEAFVDILIHGSGEPAPRQNPASSQESPSIPAS